MPARNSLEKESLGRQNCFCARERNAFLRRRGCPLSYAYLGALAASGQLMVRIASSFVSSLTGKFAVRFDAVS
jgi:hypothetical protein